jgi:hypothetical protein
MQEFRDAVERRALDELVALFADEIVLRSPAVHSPYRGRAQVETLLRAVAEVLDDFHYTRQIETPGAADSALVFRARVGDREIEGCDFVHVDDDGLIDELYVMVRPLSGLIAMARAMSAQLGLDEDGDRAERHAAAAGTS